MVISYLGKGGFRLQSGETVLLVDPGETRQRADLVLRTQAPADISEAPTDEVIFPGEYEKAGIEVQGFPLESSTKAVTTGYLVIWEEMRFAILGAIGAAPDASVLKQIAEPDIIIVPADNDKYLTYDAARKLIHQLEPSIAIISLYKNANEAAKSLGEKTEIQEKLVFKKKDLVERQGRVVVLKE